MTRTSSSRRADDRVVRLLILAAVLAVGGACESKLKTPASSPEPASSGPTTPDVGTDTDDDSTDVDTGPDSTRDDDDDDTNTSGSTGTDVVQPTPTEQDPEDDDQQGPGPVVGPRLPPSIMSAITPYMDKKVPIAPGVPVRISNMQISDTPVTEVGRSQHFRLQGGIYMSH
jgi:hypothetical protein